MNVACPSCASEYEFDDALVAAAGTRVRCTTCEHEFVLTGGRANEPWLVLRAGNTMASYARLGELQRAIATGTLHASDQLSREGLLRTLGEIEELALWFTRAAAAHDARPPTRTETALGIAPTSAALTAALTTVINSATNAAPTPSVATRRVTSELPGAESQPLDSRPQEHASSNLAPSIPMPATARARMPRQMGARVVVASVLMGAGVVLALWLRRNYAAQAVEPQAVSGAVADGLDPSLAAADRTFLEQDYEGAEKAYTALLVDPQRRGRAKTGLAEVAVARADSIWLRARARRGNDASADESITATLLPLLTRALEASSNAIADVPPGPGENIRALRARLDALRMHGDLADARALALRIQSVPGDVATPYSLAMLDLAEGAEVLQTTVQALQAAAAIEVSAGRARAALVLALGMRGDLAAAASELERLRAAPDHALVEDMRLFLRRRNDAAHSVALRGDAGADAKATANDTADMASGDARDWNTRASVAASRGDFVLARDLYGRVLARAPEDSEALAGLGDVERRAGNRTAAAALYKRALTANPNYLPARVAAADLADENGDHAGARSAYRDIVEHYPEASYPPRVRERASLAAAPLTADAPSTAGGATNSATAPAAVASPPANSGVAASMKEDAPAAPSAASPAPSAPRMVEPLPLSIAVQTEGGPARDPHQTEGAAPVVRAFADAEIRVPLSAKNAEPLSLPIDLRESPRAFSCTAESRLRHE